MSHPAPRDVIPWAEVCQRLGCCQRTARNVARRAGARLLRFHGSAETREDPRLGTVPAATIGVHPADMRLLVEVADPKAPTEAEYVKACRKEDARRAGRLG